MRLKHLFSVLLMLLTVSIGSAWGDEVTLTLSDASTDTWTNQGKSGGGQAIAMTDKDITGISLEGTSGYCNTSKKYTQIYANSTITLKSTVGKITTIVINGKYNKTSGKFTDSNNTEKALTSSFADVTFEYTTGVDEMTFTADKQNLVQSITVTYTPSGGGSPQTTD